MRAVIHRPPVRRVSPRHPCAVRVEQAVELLGQRRQGLVPAADLARCVSRSSLSRALQAGRVVQVQPRVYALAALPGAPRQIVTDEGPAPAWVAHVRATLLSLSSSAASGRTAAALRGWGLLVEPGRAVEVAVPHGRSHCAGARVRAVQLRRMTVEHVVVLPGTAALPVTDVVTTVVRCCLQLSLLEAVVVCDSALRSRAVTVEELTRAAGRLQGVRAAARVRRVLASCDPVAGSVLESVLRLRLTLAGITGLQTQVSLCDRHGRHVLRVDFCFPVARLVVEVDGARWHRDPDRDRRTDNTLAELGWRVLRFPWAEVVHDHREVVRQVRAALEPGHDTSTSNDQAGAAA